MNLILTWLEQVYVTTRRSLAGTRAGDRRGPMIGGRVTTGRSATAGGGQARRRSPYVAFAFAPSTDWSTGLRAVDSGGVGESKSNVTGARGVPVWTQKPVFTLCGCKER